MDKTRKIVIICGLPGTGKTTLAGALADVFSGVHLNTDKVRANLDRRGKYSEADKAVIYEILLRRARKEILEKHDVIVDGTFYKQALRDPFIALSKELEIKLYWIEISAPEDVVRERVSKERPYTEADFHVYRKIRDTYESLTQPHLLLNSTDMSVDEMVNAVLEYLKTD